MSKKEKKSQIEKLSGVPKEGSMVIVATGKFIGEGFDEPRLDTPFLAMSISWKGTLQQYAGRLNRLYENKNEVQIYDYIDVVQTGRLIEALDCYNKSISLDLKYEDAYIFKAEVLERLLKYEESLACYGKAILINCNNVISYNGKGHVLYLLEKYKESIEYFNIAINIDSDYAEPYYNRAILYIALNDTENCMINLKKSIKLDEEYKKFAKEERFFNSISNLKEFSDLYEMKI